MDTTPKRQTTPTHLKSTPQSAESAVSQNLTTTGLQVHVVGPWIARDIENAQRCEVDLMLKSFILDCMVDPSSTMEHANSFFETCLERVLPICNSTYIAEHLKAYSGASNENDLYPHFVLAANRALSRLQGLGELDDLRRPSKRLAFQVYGKEIGQTSQDASSVCKPDVVLVSADSIQDGGADKELFTAAAEQSKKSFSWREVHTAIKFKTSWKMTPPPPKYPNDNYIISGNCEYLCPKSFDESMMEPFMTSSQQESESQSNNDGDKEPGSSVSKNTPTRKRRAALSEVQRESQVKPGERSNKGPGSSSKQRRVERSEATPNKIVPATQTGLYGSEMFVSYAGWHHVISLTINADYLYIWRHDRQNGIRCSALNFIQDLPRFLVFLLALQRFENRHWGLNPIADPTFNKLYYIHKAGWVHRDLSVSNVFWVEEGNGWVRKLSDFEFAKEVDSEASHDVRTGTMHFMAIEVANETYLYAPQDIEEVSYPSFCMNHLHDLESLWWTAMWILFYYTDMNSPTKFPELQQRSYDEAFPAMFNTATRTSFTLRNVLLQAYSTLSETYKEQCRCILDLAHSLRGFYRRAESKYPNISVEDTLLEEAHATVSRCYADAKKSLGRGCLFTTSMLLKEDSAIRGYRRFTHRTKQS